jgi:asparagine synthetase B (glutamine-hydrolysing)
MMSDFLGTDHHEYLFTSEEACAIIPDVVYHLETYEPELIRSAIPNYFLARLASKHVKVVLTGEGSDELFAGYLYFRDAPNSAAIHKELRRIFHHLHNVNCQRADRMTMAHGLEARVPFLDPHVIDAVMQVSDMHPLLHSRLSAVNKITDINATHRSIRTINELLAKRNQRSTHFEHCLMAKSLTPFFGALKLCNARELVLAGLRICRLSVMPK